MAKNEKDKRKLHSPVCSDEDIKIHEVVSSDAWVDEEPEAEHDQTESGYMLESHGGGELEDVPGWDPYQTLTDGMGAQSIDLEDDWEAIPIIPADDDTELAAEIVHGEDDRKRVRRTAQSPWRQLCQLLMTFPNGRKYRGTGWFAGPRTVVTAGHCVFGRNIGGWASQVEIIPGLDSHRRPFGSAVSRRFTSTRGWTRNAEKAADYGAIILPDSSLGNKVGWFGFANLSTSTLRNLIAHNAGYPGDKPFGTLWYNSGRLTGVRPRQIHYRVDTYKGQSGSPVWRRRHGAWTVVGIHNYGGHPNRATRITGPVFENLRSWKRGS